MRRLRELETRRLTLLARCDQQRLEITYRLAQLNPAAQLARWTRRAPYPAGSHPLRWLVSIATLVIMMRERRLLGWIDRVSRSASLVSRIAAVVSLFRTLRAPYGASR
jgi:hypothetical protein